MEQVYLLRYPKHTDKVVGGKVTTRCRFSFKKGLTMQQMLDDPGRKNMERICWNAGENGYIVINCDDSDV